MSRADRKDERNRTARLGLALLLAAPLAACGTLAKLDQIGQPPALSAVDNPTTQPGYKPVSMPQPAPTVPYATENSLWRSGSRAFFKDQRASQIGDILTVHVSITDQANISNETKRTRTDSENMSMSNFFGLETQLKHLFPSSVAPANLVNTGSNSASDGLGSVQRSEQIVTDIAAVVTQVLPNGNLVIEGKQEVRVNFEVREMVVAGVVRPEDIEAGNVIQNAKIAQARISYGGRGQLTDVQQQRYGQQLLDILLPF